MVLHVALRWSVGQIYGTAIIIIIIIISSSSSSCVTSHTCEEDEYVSRHVLPVHLHHRLDSSLDVVGTRLEQVVDLGVGGGGSGWEGGEWVGEWV